MDGDDVSGSDSGDEGAYGSAGAAAGNGKEGARICQACSKGSTSFKAVEELAGDAAAQPAEWAALDCFGFCARLKCKVYNCWK